MAACFAGSRGLAYAAGESAPVGAVLMVPGTYNSYAPGGDVSMPGHSDQKTFPYFSNDIVGSIESAGYAVHVVTGLSPFGTIEDNGEVVRRQLLDWHARTQLPITIIAHSAGGFYALEALTRSELSGERVPVHALIFVSTPLKGAEIANRMLKSGFARRLAALVARALEMHFDLRGLLEMTTEQTHAFLEGVRLPEGIRLVTVTGSQPPLGFLDNPFDAHYLSPALSLLSTLIRRPCDGVVSVESARGEGVVLLDAQGSPVPIKTSPELTMKLDHVEQILDVRYLRRMGERQTDFIEKAQRTIYLQAIQFAQ